MAAGLEEVANAFDPIHFDRPANVGKAPTLQEAPQQIATVTLELKLIGIYVPK